MSTPEAPPRPEAPLRPEAPPRPALSTDEVERIVASSMPVPDPVPDPRRAAPRGGRAKLLGAILIAGVGIGASALSCVGQSFSLRQARALEGIEQQLMQLRASCTVREVSR